MMNIGQLIKELEKSLKNGVINANTPVGMKLYAFSTNQGQEVEFKSVVCREGMGILLEKEIAGDGENEGRSEKGLKILFMSFSINLQGMAQAITVDEMINFLKTEREKHISTMSVSDIEPMVGMTVNISPMLTIAVPISIEGTSVENDPVNNGDVFFRLVGKRTWK